MRKKVYVAASYTTTFFGPGRPEFDPKKPMPSYETYLKETAQGTCGQLLSPEFDQGVIGSFMSPRFLNQANIPGLLPMMVSSLYGKPCTGVEGACGTGGRSIAMGTQAVLSDCAESVFVAAYEIQNCVKSVYGADILAGAGYYHGERKGGHAFFFPGVFADRAGAYLEKYDADISWKAMAKWYENAILNARENPKAQEYANKNSDLMKCGLTFPNPQKFLPHINAFHCSKVSDGAASLALFSEEGLAQSGISKSEAIEIVAIGAAEGDITKKPQDPTSMDMTKIAVQKALDQANISLDEIGVLEVHDCFSISGLLALEAIGYAKPGQAPQFVLEGNTLKEGKIPTNLSGGLIGFGHPTGATGVRMLVDLHHQLTGKAENQAYLTKPYGMMVSMGGNDITTTCIIVKSLV